MNDTKALESQETAEFERIQNLTLLDGVFFSHFFGGQDELLERVLGTLLRKPVEIVDSSKLKNLPEYFLGEDLKSGVLAMDSNGTFYDIELARNSMDAHPKRARLHHHKITAHYYFDEGMDVDTCFMVIFEDWPFEYDTPIMETQTVVSCSDSEVRFPIDIGEKTVFVNASYRGDDPIGKLMHDFSCADYRDMLIPELRERMRRLKSSKREMETLSAEYSQTLDEAGKEGE